MEETILLQVSLDDLCVRVWFDIVHSLTVDMLLGTFFLIAIYAESSQPNVVSSRGTPIRWQSYQLRNATSIFVKAYHMSQCPFSNRLTTMKPARAKFVLHDKPYSKRTENTASLSAQTRPRSGYLQELVN